MSRMSSVRLALAPLAIALAVAACKPAVSDSDEGAWVQAWVFVPVQAIQKGNSDA